jgi:hypothetical protein
LPREAVSGKREPQKLEGRILKPGSSATRYFTVALCRDGKPRSHTIHSLIAEAFIGPRPEGADIDHIDGDRKNNAISNLRYVSHKINVRNRTVTTARSGRLGVHPNGSGWMAQITFDGQTKHLGTFRTIEEAASAREHFESITDHRGFQK